MNSEIYKGLDFEKIKNLLLDYCHTQSGKDYILDISPSTDLKEVISLLDKTESAFSRIVKWGQPEFNEITDFNEIENRLRLSAMLSIRELVSIRKQLSCVSNLKTYGRNSVDEDIEDSLSEAFEQIMPNKPIQDLLEKTILDDVEIADNASNELREIRGQLKTRQGRINSTLQSMISGRYKSYLMDNIITMRGNRHCLAVKSEYKSKVSGIVHDQSATGSTLFIEPQEIVQINNQIRELALAEKEEIDRILLSISLTIGEKLDELVLNQKIIRELDVIFAKAKLSRKYSGNRARISEYHEVLLKNARHPLIDKDKIVPIDIQLGIDFDLLIITGPNTGGKTVALKTVGLLSLMNQIGLLIPADEGSILPVFDNIFADIGDEQSIEQSLSTFSAHMVNIVSILNQATSKSLCLFDELGAGTDPVEGAALAMSILDSLHKQHISTIATTHYSELKLYALKTEGVENGGCEFNVNTLSPTYRLLIGIPGKSNAFAIASKLGLSKDLISNAREHISDEQESFEDLLSQIEIDRRRAQKELLKAEGIKKDALELKKRYKNELNKLELKKERLIEKATEEADELLKNAKEEVDQAIRNITGIGKNVKALEQERTKLRESRKGVQDKRSKLSPTKKSTKSKDNIDITKLQLGVAVRINSLGLEGTLSSLPDKQGNVFVQTGILRSKVNISDLDIINESDISISGIKQEISHQSKLKSQKSKTTSYELMLIGKTTMEAENLIDKFLDDAYLAGLSSVRIVHGKGTGALKKLVHDKLKNKGFIKSYRLGEFGEGDSGVTIAEYK